MGHASLQDVDRVVNARPAKHKLPVQYGVTGGGNGTSGIYTMGKRSGRWVCGVRGCGVCRSSCTVWPRSAIDKRDMTRSDGIVGL